ncbi:hypothetical protein [Scytonema sp. NUACC26]|uniref:hypothetical protein n=1 Tax=Scytonema sp. NUACC26 TaxID=3140176 RepID=UPI0034DB9D5B
MTLPELQKQALKLPIDKRWQLVQTLLESLKQETNPVQKKGNLSRLRGIAKNVTLSDDESITEDYVYYLTEKYK